MVDSVKGIEFGAINIQDGKDLAVAEEGHDDLAFREAGTSYVSGEEMYIGHDDCLGLSPSRSAYAFIKGDTRASDGSLERSEHQLPRCGRVVSVRNNAVETRPPEAKGLVQDGNHVCHVCDHVSLAGKERSDLGQDGLVFFFFGHLEMKVTQAFAASGEGVE